MFANFHNYSASSLPLSFSPLSSSLCVSLSVSPSVYLHASVPGSVSVSASVRTYVSSGSFEAPLCFSIYLYFKIRKQTNKLLYVSSKLFIVKKVHYTSALGFITALNPCFESDLLIVASLFVNLL